MRSTYSLKKFSKFTVLLLKGMVHIEGPASKQEVYANRSAFVMSVNKIFFKRKSEMYLFRALVLSGISKALQPEFKKLTLKGIGFKCYKLTSNIILLKIGYTHKIYYIIPHDNINVVCKKGRMVLFGSNLGKLNNIVYDIKKFRRPDSYKGKGIMFTDEVLKLKSSKKRA